MLFDGPPRNAKTTGIFCVSPRNLRFFIVSASVAEIQLTHPSSWASSLSVFTHNSCAFCLYIRGGWSVLFTESFPVVAAVLVKTSPAARF